MCGRRLYEEALYFVNSVIDNRHHSICTDAHAISHTRWIGNYMGILIGSIKG